MKYFSFQAVFGYFNTQFGFVVDIGCARRQVDESLQESRLGRYGYMQHDLCL